MTATRTSTHGILLALLLVAGPTLAGGPSEGQALRERGEAAMRADRYDDACLAFEQSYKLEPLPDALYALADCERLRGHSVVAAARYDEYLVLHARLPAELRAKQGDRERTAKEQREALTRPPAPAGPTSGAGPNSAVLVVGALLGAGGIWAGLALLKLSRGKGNTASSLQNDLRMSGGCPDNAPSPQCAELRDALRSKATFGNAGLWTLVGGGAVGVATVIYGIAGGSSTKMPAKSGVHVLPMVTGEGAGVMVGGTF